MFSCTSHGRCTTSPRTTSTEAWRTCAKELVRNGWKITKDGKANSKAQQPEIFADNKAEQFAVHVQGLKRKDGDRRLAFTVVSACFRAESPEALKGQY